MYTQKDQQRMETWQRITVKLQDALAMLETIDEKPSVQFELYKLIETSKVQAKLWQNPDMCQCGHLNEEHEKLNGPCNVRTATKHCVCYRFSFEPKDSIGE